MELFDAITEYINDANSTGQYVTEEIGAFLLHGEPETTNPNRWEFSLRPNTTQSTLKSTILIGIDERNICVIRAEFERINFSSNSTSSPSLGQVFAYASHRANIAIKRCKISDEGFSLSGVTDVVVDFVQCKFCGHNYLSSVCKNSRISFDRCEIGKDDVTQIDGSLTLELHSDASNTAITFHKKCFFEGEISLRLHATNPAVIFNDCEFTQNSEFYLEGNDGGSIKVEKCRLPNKLKIRNTDKGTYAEQQKNKAHLEKLEIIDCEMNRGNTDSNPYLRVVFLHAENFELSNFRIPKDAEVNIGDCDFDNFTLSKVRNLGKLKLYNINADVRRNTVGKFQIDSTTIGDADFHNLRLVSYKTRKIYDNILSGIDYSNVRWEERQSKDIEVGGCNPGGSTELSKKRDTYRALKNVAQNNNDQPQAFAFYAKEMKYHWRLVNKSRKENRQEWIILAFNRATSNFGQSWVRPLLCLLGIGIVFYSLLLFSVGLCPLELANWFQFPEFLNPTHKVRFIAKDCWGFLAGTVDILFRVLEGGLIYQAIQAFRRHSRKV